MKAFGAIEMVIFLNIKVKRLMLFENQRHLNDDIYERNGKLRSTYKLIGKNVRLHASNFAAS